VRNAVEVQNLVLKQEPLLDRAAIPASTFHLTLCVLTLKNEEEVAKATELLSLCDLTFPYNSRSSSLKPLQLTFSGLGHFRNQVLFAKPAKKRDDGFERLCALQRRLCEHFEASDLEMEDSGRFEPHLTLFKLSKDPKLRYKVKRNCVLLVVTSQVTTHRL
jgi:2'-5' RNA ligase